MKKHTGPPAPGTPLPAPDLSDMDRVHHNIATGRLGAIFDRLALAGADDGTPAHSGASSDPSEGAGCVLYYRVAPHDTYVVFAPPTRARHVDQIHRAIEESKTWGEFRRRLPEIEYQRLYAKDHEARETADDEPFNSDCVPGYSDGDYPPWLAPEQHRYLPASVLNEFATRGDTFINGSFWRLDATRAAVIMERLQRLGYKVEHRDDLKFW